MSLPPPIEVPAAPTDTNPTTEFEHVDAHGAGHSDHDHVRPHQQRDAVIKRLKRAEGHLAAVRRMVEDERDCPEVLLQIAAVRAALDATARVVLADHMQSCLLTAQSGEASIAWEELHRALDSFIR